MFEKILTTIFNFELKEKIDLIELKLKQKTIYFKFIQYLNFKKDIKK
jgi:hypothetical protein